MDNWYSLWMQAHIRHDEYERQAKRQRLVNDALSVRRGPRTLLSRILLSFGTWLIERGWQLQQTHVRPEVLQWGEIEVRYRKPCQPGFDNG